MARKIFMRGPGSGNKPDSGSSTTTVVTGGASGGSMMLLLLLVALVAFILMKGRSRGGSSSTNSSGESAEDRRKRKEAEAKAKAAADKQAEDSKNNGKNTDSSKAKKVASDPGVVHRPAKVDEEYDKKHAAQPDNPFYIHRPLPQDWTGDEPIEMKPVPKLPPEEIEKLKPAKPPSKDGRTVPDPNRVKKKKSVEWLNGANATELGKEAVKEVRDMKYLTTESTPVKLEDFHRREEGQSGVRHTKTKTGEWQPKSLANLEITGLSKHLTELLEAMQKPPLSVAGDDLDILRTFVQQITAKRDSDEHKALLVEQWDDTHGPGPHCATRPLGVLIKHIQKDGLYGRLRGALAALNEDHNKTFNKFLNRLGAGAQPTAPAMVTGLFFEQFRMLNFRRLGLYVYPELDNEEKKTKGGYQLLLFNQYMARALGQVWLMSHRGIDLYGLTLRVSLRPYEFGDDEDPAKRLCWFHTVGLFLPASQGGNILQNWINTIDCAKASYNTVRMLMFELLDQYNLWMDEREPHCQSRLLIRPGWVPGAVNQAVEGGAEWDERAKRIDWKSNGIPLWDPCPKGLLVEPGAEIMYKFVAEMMSNAHFNIIDFQRRGQYSWSGNSNGQRPDGFRQGQIRLCLEVFGKWIAMPRMEKEQLGAVMDFAENELTTHSPYDPIRTINFGDSIPLEFEKEKKDGKVVPDGKDVYTFPTLKYFPGLKQIYLPYVSVPPNIDTAAPSDRYSSTAILALSKPIGLWEQLHGRKLLLVVITKQLAGADGAVKSASEWRSRLVDELKEQGEEEGIAVADWKERIKWVEEEAQGQDYLLHPPQPLKVE